MVTIDAEDEGDTLPSMVFQLVDNNSMSLMTTPVRSRHCEHFQCFDLGIFLQLNKRVTGTRFECPVCSKRTVNIFDLQHCDLTLQLLRQFEKEASSFRSRIRFFQDGTWHLMAENKKRHARVDNGAGGGGSKKKQKATPEIIIL